VVPATRLLDKKAIGIWKMFDKLIGVEERFVEVEKQLADPAIVQDREAYQKYVREHGELNKIVGINRCWVI